jgi:glycosyltransferase involved in cell wall biosynthesis
MKQKYKIGFALPNLENPGGPVVNVKKLTEYFRYLGHEVHLFPFGKTEYNDDEFIHIIDENKYKKQKKVFEEKYFKELSKGKFDIFIANNLRTHRVAISLNLENLLLVFRQGKFIQRSSVFGNFFKKFSVQKRYNNQNLAAVSECLLENIINMYQVKPLSQSVLYNPFGNEQLLTKSNEKVDGILLDDDYIVTVSRLSKGKRIEEIIEAYRKLDTKNKLYIIGDGEEKEFLENEIKKYNLEDKVLLLGWKSNPYPYIKNANLYVSASGFEGLPTVLLEALELKTPVVSSDCRCGPSEILMGEFKNFLFDVGNINQMAEKMKLALVKYPDIENLDVEKFKIENICENYIKIIEQFKKDKNK